MFTRTIRLSPLSAEIIIRPTRGGLALCALGIALLLPLWPVWANALGWALLCLVDLAYRVQFPARRTDALVRIITLLAYGVAVAQQWGVVGWAVLAWNIVNALIVLALWFQARSR
jgi:hypothetical protein